MTFRLWQCFIQCIFLNCIFPSLLGLRIFQALQVYLGCIAKTLYWTSWDHRDIRSTGHLVFYADGLWYCCRTMCVCSGGGEDDIYYSILHHQGKGSQPTSTTWGRDKIGKHSKNLWHILRPATNVPLMVFYQTFGFFLSLLIRIMVNIGTKI